MSDKEPRYREVINWIQKSIEEGSLKEGDRLPSEKELCERFGLSRQTIRHATGELEEKGVITRVRGSGSYVGASRLSERRPKYMSVAVVVTYVDSYIFPPVIQGISSTLGTAGYTTQISFTENCVDREEAILQSIIENDNVDAVIAEPSKGALPNPNRKYYEILRERHIPVLFVNAAYPGLDIPCVKLDDEEIGREAAHILADRGHTEVGCILHCEDIQGRIRYRGFLKGLREAGLILHSRYTIWLDTNAIGNMDPLMDYIKGRLSGCTAVLTYNDEVAYQLVKGLKERGISLPKDLSIVSVDDADLSTEISPQITTFPHPKMEMGKKAAEILLGMIRNPLLDGNYLFRPEVIGRQSVIDRRTKKKKEEKYA